MPPSDASPKSPLGRLPFFYGWVVVGVAFVTMAIGVNIRTSFSLLFPPILDEFGWSRGETAAAFSIGFVVSAALAPVLGIAMDRFGVQRVMPLGACLVGAGLALATLVTQPWHLYLTLGVLVTGGTVTFSYIGHSMFLPHWFVRRRGLAIGIAFSGVGVGSISLFPALQTIIGALGWRQACWTMAGLLLAVVLPLNLLLQRHRPEQLGLRPYGADAALEDGSGSGGPAAPSPSRAARDWTLGEALATGQFWWLGACFFFGLVAWYTVQVHQTKYLLEVGFGANAASYALGAVGLTGIVGQIGVGYLSDRIGRAWGWTVAGSGFVLCYAILLVMQDYPAPALMWLMVAAQGMLGYGVASVFGTTAAEFFPGRALATTFGVLSLASALGAGFGPWLAGAMQDVSNSYAPAFSVGLAASLASICFFWAATLARDDA